MTSSPKPDEYSGPVGRSTFGVVQSLPWGSVRVESGLFGSWAHRNRCATIPHGIRMLEESGNLDNFRRLVGESEAPYRGQLFADSDVYKMLEAVAWELGRAGDPQLRAFYDQTVGLLERAQCDDGYLNSCFQRPEHPRGRWSDFAHGHELYCLGHLIQAAIAGKRAIGDNRLLALTGRYVDLVHREFGAEDSAVVCGHPEVEMALVEFSRLTGDVRHLALASAFVERRGRGFIGEAVFGAQYYQDDTPVRSTRIMRGHAVRALYLNAGVADLLLESGDAQLLEVMDAQWDDLVRHKLYLTGGSGSRHRDEAFGDAYELPSERAYAETCAAIALMQWAWRMFLVTGASRFIDVFEQAMYNTMLAGIDEQGTRFFYSNPLQRRPDHGASQQESSGFRQSWFDCACCPPNLMRTFATLSEHIAVSAPEELRICLYTDARISHQARAERVVLDIETGYPMAGRVHVRVASGSAPDTTLSLRIPSSARLVRAEVNGRACETVPAAGWLRLPGVLIAGGEIVIELELEPLLLAGHPRIDAIRGALAVTRGPVVYCLDQVDNDDDVDDLALLPGNLVELTDSDGMVTLVQSVGPLLRAGALRPTQEAESTLLYSPWNSSLLSGVSRDLTLRPYATWGAGQDLGGMRVWIPQAPPERTKEKDKEKAW